MNYDLIKKAMHDGGMGAAYDIGVLAGAQERNEWYGRVVAELEAKLAERDEVLTQERQCFDAAHKIRRLEADLERAETECRNSEREIGEARRARQGAAAIIELRQANIEVLLAERKSILERLCTMRSNGESVHGPTLDGIIHDLVREAKPQKLTCLGNHFSSPSPCGLLNCLWDRR